MFVLLTGPPNPLVRAAAFNSSPILTEHMMTGTSLYSSIALALPPPKRIPLIFIASPMALYSSTTVGKNRNITDIGMMICSGKCSFFMEATNSLTVVVLTVMYPIIIPGTNRIKKPQIATTRKLGRPDRWGSAHSCNI